MTNRFCQDCGELVAPFHSRRRCKECGRRVCPHCFARYHRTAGVLAQAALSGLVAQSMVRPAFRRVLDAALAPARSNEVPY